jgi:bifunctional UDP-N-acetylglucosamine pyrophosphorylase/glucosamine-1-phosphate N-acetyltransferase
MSTAVILAAGHGTRMRSARPKAMQPLAGRPMLRHLIATCEAAFDRIVVVVGPGMDELAALAAPHRTVVQHERLGTAHAALQAEAWFGDGDVAILYADNPLITAGTLAALARARVGAELAMLGMRPPDPGRYGRVIARDGVVERIVEYADATEAERTIALCNAGVFRAAAADMRGWLRRVTPSAGGEYYLTDIVPLAGRVVAVEAPWEELRGINTRAELAAAEATAQQALRARAMADGATLTAPETVFLAYDTVLAEDVTVGPHVVFGPGVTVDEGAEIRAFCHLEGCAVAAGAIIGPFARLRPGTRVGPAAHVGNFVELKATMLGAGAKANHLAYLGDATVGAGTNIGAGTITCNFDGVAKHPTTIGDHAFVGSNATLVAPITIGSGAFIAAGSTITEPVPADALAFGRARQDTKPGLAGRVRRWLKERTP